MENLSKIAQGIFLGKKKKKNSSEDAATKHRGRPLKYTPAFY